MKILVAGGRKYGEFSYKERQYDGSYKEFQRDTEQAKAERWCMHYALKLSGATYIVQGNARGADKMSQFWAEKNGIPHSGDKFSAEWDKYGKAAGQIRNKRMLDENPDIECVYAFEGGFGTANMIKQAQERNITVVEPKIREVSND